MENEYSFPFSRSANWTDVVEARTSLSVLPTCEIFCCPEIKYDTGAAPDGLVILIFTLLSFPSPVPDGENLGVAVAVVGGELILSSYLATTENVYGASLDRLSKRIGPFASV